MFDWMTIRQAFWELDDQTPIAVDYGDSRGVMIGVWKVQARYEFSSVDWKLHMLASSYADSPLIITSIVTLYNNKVESSLVQRTDIYTRVARLLIPLRQTRQQ